MPLGPLGMARDVVRERAGVTQPERGHAGTVRRRVSAERSDLVVVGAGAAGPVRLPRRAARAGARVTLVSARPLAETASYWAQGGLAAALAVERLARAPPGGHAGRRPRHRAPLGRRGADRRGARPLPRPRGARRALRRRPPRQRRARARGRPQRPPRRPRRRQRDRPPHPAPAVRRRRRGARDRRAGGRPRREPGRRRALHRRAARGRRARWRARGTILATGGAAALWSRTTNPPGSFGSGLLLAHAAGAALADLEFVQFHPTAVVGINGREGFLITEAIRGEGATLHDAGGERFVDELAPRDAVARAIFRTLREQGVRGGQPRHARRRPGAVPERRRRAARGRARPGHASSCRSRPPATT